MAATKRTTNDIINSAVALVTRLAAAGLMLSVAYLLFQVFSGTLKVYPAGFTPQTSNRLTHDVQMAGEASLWSGGLLVIGVIVLLCGVEWLAPVFLAAGALFYIGLPYLSVPQLSPAAMKLARPNHPGADVLGAWRLLGGEFALGGVALLVLMAWERLQMSLSAPRRAAGGRLKVPFYSSCWQTHYCKDEINKLCAPGSKGFKRSCWRYKSGCFCDASIGDKVLATARKEAGPDAAKWFGQAEMAPKITLSDRFKSTHYRIPGQKIACADCPIYNYHEIQKHRILAPIMLLMVPAVMYWQADRLHSLFTGLVAGLDRVAMHLAYTSQGTAIIQNQIHSALGVPGIEWLVFGVVVLLLITWVARGLEYWCFTAKL